MAFGRTAGAAAAYVVLAGLQRSISLLILPFITHAMTPAEYGAASMLAAASLFITAVIATPLSQLVVRATARGDKDGPDGAAHVRAAGLYCYFIVPVISAVTAAASAFLVPSFLGVRGYIWAIEILAIGFQPAASTFALWVAQARQDLARFAAISFTSVAVTTASKLIFVVILRQGVLGWVISDLVSAVLTAVLAVVLVRLPHATLSSHHLRYLLSFALPLIPHSASLWALTFLSRPAMAAVTTLDQVGLFSFGLNLAQVAGLILAEANRAALVRYSRESFPAPTEETRGIVRWQLVGAFLVPAAVGAAISLTGRWIFDDSYWPSFALTGIILVGQLAYGLYFIPMNFLTQTAGQPRYSALASGASAVVILVAILFLGRAYGAVGVAYGTTAAYSVLAAVAAILTIAHKLDIAWKVWLSSRLELALAALALAFSVTALTAPSGSNNVWAYNSACLALLLAATMLTVRRGRP